jgi:hypothetical protein
VGALAHRGHWASCVHISPFASQQWKSIARGAQAELIYQPILRDRRKCASGSWHDPSDRPARGAAYLDTRTNSPDIRALAKGHVSGARLGFVFINYRRAQAAGEARALSKDLGELIGHERVFMDVDDIALGRDFRQVLAEHLDGCDVMLTLIGRDWSDSRDDRGQRRLDNASDFVRIEIATALKRNIAVTPVLLQGARMPDAAALPEDLRDLAFRNGFEISHTRWESDVKELVRRLGLEARAPAMPPSPAALPRRGTALWAIAAVAILAVGAGAWLQTQRDPAPIAVQRPTPAPPPPSPSSAPIPSTLATQVTQLLDPADSVQATALEALRRDHLGSSLAVDLVLNQLLDGMAAHSLRGRLEMLIFLNESAANVWTPQHRAKAAEAVRLMREAMDAGRYKPAQRGREQIDALAKRAGV